MASPLLARRTREGDVLITDDVTPIRVAWNDLRSSDGHTIRIEWEARVACVDSPADRQLLSEAFLANLDASLSAADLASHFERAVAPELRRSVSTETSDDLLNGSRDVGVSRLLATEAGQAAFAAGLSVLPPYTLRIESPSFERDRRLAEVRSRLDTLHAEDGRKLAGLNEAARLLASHGDAGRTASLLADLRLADPLDLLRAAALADATWSAPAPSLWIVAGTRLARVDPTKPMIDAKLAKDLGDTLGPLRSVRPVSIDGADVLLLGARDGVYVVDRDRGDLLTTFRHNTGSEFGFNAACYLASTGQILATHSTAGVVAWRFDAPDVAATVWPAENARSIVADAKGTRALAVSGGRVVVVDPTRGVAASMSMPLAAGVVPGVDGQFVTFAEAGDVRLATVGELEAGGGMSVHAGAGVLSAASLDLAGIPRAVVALVAGGLRVLDFAGAPPLSIGPAGLPVRTLSTRNGFVAGVTVDRSRIVLIDLARPDSLAAELHLSATLGNRAADVWFA